MNLMLLRSLAALVALGSVVCRAQTLVFTNDQFVVVASAAPTTTFIGGVGNESLSIDQSTGDFGGADGSSHGLIRFLDLALPTIGTITSARLEFYSIDDTGGPVDVYQATTNWGLSSTWASLGGDGVTPGVETALNPVASTSITGVDQIVSFDVTATVNAWASGTPALGFGVINQSTDGWDVLTVDTPRGFGPRLVVDVVVPPPAKLQIDPRTGYARLTSTASIPVELRSYEILSEGLLLNPATWEPTNLAARNVDAIDPNLPGQSWDTVAATTEQLFEAYLLGGTPLAPGQSVVIGQVMNPLGPGAAVPDLDVTILTTNFLGGADEFNSFSGVTVELAEFSLPAVPGDFSGDGRVDAADLTLLLNNWGSATPPIPAGWNGSPPTAAAIDADELTALLNNWGAGAAAATPIPEPASSTIAVTAVAAWLLARRRRAA